jgi:hypothetical protein
VDRLSASYSRALNAGIPAGSLMANIQILERANLPPVRSKLGVCLNLMEKGESICSVIQFLRLNNAGTTI